MKIHTKKKTQRREWRENQRKGLMNGPDGLWKNRASFPDNSMRRDYNAGRGTL